jgi:hypothetical protein
VTKEDVICAIEKLCNDIDREILEEMKYAVEHTKENNMTTRELILEILEQNSGGMKFLELIVELTKVRYERSLSVLTSPDDILSLCMAMPEVKVVEYTWKSMNRAKYFICTE